MTTEFAEIDEVLGREPNHLELALFGVMWSEHCSYKSSRLHLRRLPTSAPHVLVGPGENAGVIDAGDGIAVAIRIESHNHPSAIEPYQGAATGVGGILRDVFTMGARPLAVMDPLFFGELSDARQRWLLEGVVSGISGYGNSVGVPTIGGELTFDDCYAANPLVNVLCVGALPTERLVLGVASGVGNLAVLLGSRTGRDGIGGVSVLASAGFGGEDGAASLDDAKRPSVQVGDPYEEKRLIEACLALLDAGLVVGIQDLGGRGTGLCARVRRRRAAAWAWTSTSRAVPLREAGMAPYEIMTSESQERMLAIITPENLEAVAGALCEKWEVRASVVGRVVEPEVRRERRAPRDAARARRLRRGDSGRGSGGGAGRRGAPLRPAARAARRASTRCAPTTRRRRADGSASDDLLAMLVDPAWVYRQYDSQLFLNTVVGPGRDAALLRLARPGPARLARGHRALDRLEPALVRARSSPRHRLTRGRGRGEPRLRGRERQGRRELPQLRQPRAPRGHVAARRVDRRDGRGVRGPRAAGHRRQRLALQRERRARTSTRPRCSACSAWSTHLVAGPPGWDWREGDAAGAGGGAPRARARSPSPSAARAWATRHGRRGGASRTSTSRGATTVDFVPTRWRRSARVAASDVTAVHDVGGGGLAARWARWWRRPGSASRVDLEAVAELFSEFPGRFVVATSDAEAFAERAGAPG